MHRRPAPTPAPATVAACRLRRACPSMASSSTPPASGRILITEGARRRRLPPIPEGESGPWSAMRPSARTWPARRRLAQHGDGNPRRAGRRPEQGPSSPPRTISTPRCWPSGCPGITGNGKIFAGVDLDPPAPDPVPLHGALQHGRHPHELSRRGDDYRRRRHPETVVQGLFAVGEAACSFVHSANRLGSNSLIDLVVVRRAAGTSQKELIQPAHAELPGRSVMALTRRSTISAMPRAAADRRSG